jgi:hypothetical protein
MNPHPTARPSTLTSRAKRLAGATSTSTSAPALAWTLVLALTLAGALPLGCNGDSGGDAPKPVGAAQGLALVNSDESSATSISLASPETGLLVQGDCINSGATAPGLTLALSGDVVLASDAQPGGGLLFIDRTNDAITWLDAVACQPLRQLSVATGFSSNPHDVVGLSASKAYVTRFEKNPTPTAASADNDEGDDLLVIDPSVPSITKRIDLAPYATPVAGVTIQARPDRAVLAGGKLYVTLDNETKDFMTTAEGRLVIVDTASDTVSGTIDLPGLKGCSSPQYLAAASALFVVCGGSFNDADQAAESAIVEIDLSVTPPAVSKTLGATAFGGRAISSFTLAMTSATTGLAVTYGSFDGTTPDQLWSFDLGAGTATKILDASTDFVLGTVLADSAQKQAYVTDANMTTPLVRLFDISTPGAPVAKSSFVSNPDLGLPPRMIGRY